MNLKQYQIDAFTDKIFGGNPAAVVPLEAWLPDNLMLKIAMENNLAETAFYVKENNDYRIRWFTPTVEVDLCGHATLASAFVLFNYENFSGDKIIFNSRSGPLMVTKENDLITLNFPKDILTAIALSEELTSPFEERPVEAFKGKTDYMLVFENEKQIKSMRPDMRLIGKMNVRGVIVTAKGDKVDFVSRFFGPQSGGDEDPVTGSAHTSLTPYWARILGKTEMTAMQLSEREGHLAVKLNGDRIDISGKARLFMTGTIFIDD